ncbi:MAG: PDZ domain-containing protein [Planctomycetia bacterium]
MFAPWCSQACRQARSHAEAVWYAVPVRLAMCAVWLCGGLAGAAEPSAAPDPAEIRGLIEQLASEQFAQREAATRSLAAAGRPAIEPLREAIRRGDLEVSSRAVEILREMLAGEDADLATAAERTLESLAEGADDAVAGMAEATLDFHMLGVAEAARARLETLGAVVTEGMLNSGQRGFLVLLNARWKGTTEDLRLLVRLRRVLQVGVHGVRLDDAGLAVLGRMRWLEQLQLYGTGTGDAAIEALAEKLPDTKIDVRKGGKLGVAGQGLIGPCVITHVQEDSAAAKAGLQMGDIVLRIDGEPVANFESLTDLVGRHGPGEKIEVDVQRGGENPGDEPQRFQRTVELGGWE